MIIKKIISKVFKTYKKIKKNKAKKYFFKKSNFGAKNDFLLISFPKSGNTWLRTILAYLLDYPNSNEISFKNIHLYIPDSHIPEQLYLSQNKNSLFNNLQVRIIKSHDAYNSFYKNKKVIYLVREGKSVIHSYINYLNARRTNKLNSEEFFKKINITDWSYHYFSWKNSNEKVLFVKYEDLKNSPKTELKKILKFINLDKNNKAIEYALKKASIKSMKFREEKIGYYNDNRINKNINFVNTKKNFFFSEKELKNFEKVNIKAYKELNYKTKYFRK